MRKGQKGGGGSLAGAAAHRRMKDRARSRVDDLQEMLAGMQSARRESRTAEAAAFEDRVHRMLSDWKAELNEPSPSPSASHPLANSHSSSDLSSYIRRMLQLNEEEDDATSKLAEPPAGTNPKIEPVEPVQTDTGGIQFVNSALLEELLGAEDIPNNLLHQQQFYTENQQNFQPNPQQFLQNTYLDSNLNFLPETNTNSNYAIYTPVLASSFLGPKCALWDCPRPAHTSSEWYQDYCSGFHASLALNEGPTGMPPVLRPGGIDLKDGPLFAALSAKIHGKNVGIPECEGAATTKSPWNAPELFDLSVLAGESLREWLFFDKPRRAFESGTRKQRSLPDYVGRGWHESRKQLLKEFNGLKRSYYMDPQPLANYEWHLYEYESDGCDACALYRLELKLVDPKKSSKGKVNKGADLSLVDLQQQMGRLNAKNNSSNNNSGKVRGRVEQRFDFDQKWG